MIRQRRRPALRLFDGPAGSPLARFNTKLAKIISIDSGKPKPGDGMADVAVEILVEDYKKKRGRPRTNENNAAKQKRYRNKKKIDDAIKRAFIDHADTVGQSMTDAPAGKGRIKTGGFDQAELESIDTAHLRVDSYEDTDLQTLGPKSKGRPDRSSDDEAE